METKKYICKLCGQTREIDFEPSGSDFDDFFASLLICDKCAAKRDPKPPEQLPLIRIPKSTNPVHNDP